MMQYVPGLRTGHRAGVTGHIQCAKDRIFDYDYDYEHEHEHDKLIGASHFKVA
jgi:hypothetical protein